MQATFEFPTGSAYNFEKLSGNNKKVFDALMRGEIINALTAVRDYRVGNLFARIHDITKRLEVDVDFIKRERVKIEDTYYINYSLTEDKINNLKTKNNGN